MRRIHIIGATAACGLIAAAANADRLHPVEGRTLEFGPMHASVYYTEDGSGDRVVATVIAGPESTPMRLIATLQPGQSLILSVPGAAGTPAVGFRLTQESGGVGVSALGIPID